MITFKMDLVITCYTQNVFGSRKDYIPFSSYMYITGTPEQTTEYNISLKGKYVQDVYISKSYFSINNSLDDSLSRCISILNS